MIIYPDTSFILSLWHAQDVNYPAATELFSRFSKDTWIWCDLHQLEVPIAAQVATHREPERLQEHVARTILFGMGAGGQFFRNVRRQAGANREDRRISHQHVTWHPGKSKKWGQKDVNANLR